MNRELLFFLLLELLTYIKYFKFMKLFVIHFPKVMYGYYLNLTFNVKNAFFCVCHSMKYKNRCPVCEIKLIKLR